MAHNRLHKVVHDSSASPEKEWSNYLAELQTAWDVSEQQSVKAKATGKH